MEDSLDFLNEFAHNKDGSLIVYELFTFDNLFKLFLSKGLTHDAALENILSKSSISALVFQERIHTKKYRLLNGKDALSPSDASIKPKLIKDILKL